VLHYTATNAPLWGGDLLDRCRLQPRDYYNAHQPETFPSMGIQRRATRPLELVLAAPGRRRSPRSGPEADAEQVHGAALSRAPRGLVDLGLWLEKWMAWIEQGPTATLHAPHGHGLGLDVHPDVGALSASANIRSRLGAGMVLTWSQVLYVHIASHPEANQASIPLESIGIRNRRRCGPDSGAMSGQRRRDSSVRRWSAESEPAASHLSRLAAESAEVRGEQTISPQRRSVFVGAALPSPTGGLQMRIGTTARPQPGLVAVACGVQHAARQQTCHRDRRGWAQPQAPSQRLCEPKQAGGIGFSGSIAHGHQADHPVRRPETHSETESRARTLTKSPGDPAR